jgi:hypothetical protein
VEVKFLRGRLDLARTSDGLSGSSSEVKEIENKLHDLYEKEEIMYRQ